MPDMYECPAAAKATHTAANIAARVARIGAKVSGMAGTCSHGGRCPPMRGPYLIMIG
ncbi:hypothetical protein GCM10010336_36920 [Streptomyces goshikiensis]|nr:hypothetical protein GCM10010336_36920 [Streptomyces goshikiensis]